MTTFNVPTVAFFNTKGGVGKTNLVYHLARFISSEMGRLVIAVDFDPQQSLTQMLMRDIGRRFTVPTGTSLNTIAGAFAPYLKGESESVDTVGVLPLEENLMLVRAGTRLQEYEIAMAKRNEDCYLSLALQNAITGIQADSSALVLIDMGSGLGVVNRFAITAAQYLVVPFTCHSNSVDIARVMGRTVNTWREEWVQKAERAKDVFDQPFIRDIATPLGYTILNPTGSSAPTAPFAKTSKEIPAVFRESFSLPGTPPKRRDPYCLGRIRNFANVFPQIEKERRPIFGLHTRIANYQPKIRNAREDFGSIAKNLMEAVDRKTD